MGDTRVPERDQPLPEPGKLPVQEIMIRAIGERREHGKRKYGRALETHNGRDALKDAWEEALDLFTYLTQMRLERGDVLPGMDDLFGSPESEAQCSHCNHEPHYAGFCKAAPFGSLCACDKGPLRKNRLDKLILSACPRCAHEPHVSGHCRVAAGPGRCGCGAEMLLR
jgi:hypothetical protein